MRIAIAGSGGAAAWIFYALHRRSHHQLVGVILDGRVTRGLNRWFEPNVMRFVRTSNSLAGVARRHGMRMTYLDRMTDDELRRVRDLRADLILSEGMSIIFRKPLLDIPPLGCVNCHASLLPRHRGSDPYGAAILSRDGETGVTFHVMDEGIDTGPILAQYRLPIGDTDTAGSLYGRCAALSGKTVIDVMDRIEREGVCGRPQDAAVASYSRPPDPESRQLRWQLPAESLHRLVRACSPFRPATFLFRRHVVSVTEASYDPVPAAAAPGTVLRVGEGVDVATGAGTLRILSASIRRPIPGAWPGWPLRPRAGERLAIAEGTSDDARGLPSAPGAERV